MTSRDETGRLKRQPAGLRLAAVAAAAFVITLAALRVGDAVARSRPQPAPEAATAGDEVTAAFSGWPSAGVCVVAADIVHHGVPLPASAIKAYGLAKSGVWGLGFQGFYEVPEAPAAVAGFFTRLLPQAGWKQEDGLTSALARAGADQNLSFVRGSGRVLLAIFPAAGGTELRLSVTSRSQQARR